MTNFFRVYTLNIQKAQIAANFLLNTMHKKRIAIIYDQTTAFSTNLKDDFAQDIPKNTVGSASFIGDDPKTLQDTLTNMLAQKPDAIFFSGYLNDLFVLLKIISS